MTLAGAAENRPIRRVQITNNPDLGGYTPTEPTNLRDWAAAHLRAGWSVTVTGDAATATSGRITKTAHT
jgi:hypothetical protein